MTNISETTNKLDQIDYNAARERLHTISTDPDVLAGFERVVLIDDFDDDFLKAIVATRISLAHAFQGRGAPFVPAQPHTAPSRRWAPNNLKGRDRAVAGNHELSGASTPLQWSGLGDLLQGGAASELPHPINHPEIPTTGR